MKVTARFRFEKPKDCYGCIMMYDCMQCKLITEEYPALGRAFTDWLHDPNGDDDKAIFPQCPLEIEE